jgi:hypothetical protein
VESFLSFGVDLPVVAVDAVDQLLATAQAEGLMPLEPRSGLLDDPDSGDPDHRLAQVGLFVQRVGPASGLRAIVASRLYTADADGLQWIDEDDLNIDDDHERLSWALKVLGLTSDVDAGKTPRWLLGLSTG